MELAIPNTNIDNGRCYDERIFHHMQLAKHPPSAGFLSPSGGAVPLAAVKEKKWVLVYILYLYLHNRLLVD